MSNVDKQLAPGLMGIWYNEWMNEYNGQFRLSGEPPVMFNMNEATQTGCYSFVYQLRTIESLREFNKIIINIQTTYATLEEGSRWKKKSVCSEEVLKIKQTTAWVKKLHMLIHLEQANKDYVIV